MQQKGSPTSHEYVQVLASATLHSPSMQWFPVIMARGMPVNPSINSLQGDVINCCDRWRSLARRCGVCFAQLIVEIKDDGANASKLHHQFTCGPLPQIFKKISAQAPCLQLSRVADFLHTWHTQSTLETRMRVCCAPHHPAGRSSTLLCKIES